MQIVRIVNQTHPVQKQIKAQYCDSFMGRLRGLMFRKSLTPHEGLLMVQPSASRIDASIHMFFMNFDIATVWLDPQLRVVDVQLARRWRPAYFPAGPAKYILETHPDRLADFHPGDQVALEQCV